MAIPLFRGIPGNRVNGIFYKSRYCEDRDNRGPDNRGLAVRQYCDNDNIVTILSRQYCDNI